MTDAEKIYKEKIKFYSTNFIYTRGGGNVELFTKNFTAVYPARKVEVCSTVGAGDNFNAGVIYGIVKGNYSRNELSQLSQEQWSAIVEKGLDFSSHACTILDNYVEKEWAQAYRESGN